ncbi:hypothetical protein NG827_09420 [Xanthomonas sacchari]|uniref:hypothetical protein n=1 Tax=Xanthomonas sacchari TaxID=56458 RepID=UPI002259682C|nr:hypothetical protein [Xanthomonas sacchari]UYK86595.1 hypothetical protein NG827_09420 [Xanthomonas sacchari]
MKPLSMHAFPQQVQEVAAVIGRHLALRLAGEVFRSRHIRNDGGRSRVGILYVPATMQGDSFEQAVRIIGEDAAHKLVATFGGTELRFGRCKVLADRVRDSSIRDYWRNSTLSAPWVAWMHDVSERQVRNICAGEPRLAYVNRLETRSATDAAA